MSIVTNHIKEQFVGANYGSAVELHATPSGGVPSRVVVRSELVGFVGDELAAEAQARVAQINALALGLSQSQVEGLISDAITEAIAGVFHLKGEWAGDATTLPANPVDGDTYRILSGGAAFGFPASVGDLAYYAGGQWRKIDNVDPAVAGVNDNPVEVTASANGYEVKLSAGFIARVAAAELAIQTEVTMRANDVWALQEQIETEVAARMTGEAAAQTAITAEAAARAQVQTNLSNFEATQSATNANTATAITALQTADTVIQNRATQIEAVNSTQQTAISELQTNLQAKADQSDLSLETTNRVAGDAALNGRVSNVEADMASLTDALDVEVADSLARDTAQDSRLTALESTDVAQADAIGAAQAAITDAQATIWTHGQNLAALDSEKLGVDDFLAYEQFWYAHNKRVVDLTSTDNAEVEEVASGRYVTTFYTPGFSGEHDFIAAAIKEYNPPYTTYGDLDISYVPESDVPVALQQGNSWYFVKITLVASAAVPAIKVFLDRYPSTSGAFALTQAAYNDALADALSS